MSQILIALPRDTEEILEEIRSLLQAKAQYQLKSQLGPSVKGIQAPLGRPKKAFKLTSAQLAHANELLKSGKVKQSEAYVQELRDAWSQARGEEDALRELAKRETLERLSIKRAINTQRPSKASTLAGILETTMSSYRDALKAEVAALPPIIVQPPIQRELPAKRERVFDTSGVKAVSPKKKTR